MSGISIGAGTSSIVESNRILDCASGIVVRGDGHTVANNCIVRCGEAIGVKGAASVHGQRAASNILIENNTCVGNGHGPKGGAGRVAGVRLEPGTTAIIRRNLFSGEGRPYDGVDGDGKDRSLVVENIASGQCEPMKGVAGATVAFKNAQGGDFTNHFGYGAVGWVLTPDTFDPKGDAADTKYCVDQDTRDEEDDSELAEIPEAGAEDFEEFMERFYSKETVREDKES